MPASDIFNHNTQFLLGIEEDVATTSIFKRMPCSILVVYASNYFGLARAFSPSYKLLEGKKRGGFGGFIRDILIENGLFGGAHSRRHERSMLNQTSINIYIDPTAIYPFVHTCMPFNSVQDISRQKNVSCDWQREEIKLHIYIIYCAQFCHT